MACSGPQLSAAATLAVAACISASAYAQDSDIAADDAEIPAAPAGANSSAEQAPTNGAPIKEAVAPSAEQTRSAESKPETSTVNGAGTAATNPPQSQSSATSGNAAAQAAATPALKEPPLVEIKGFAQGEYQTHQDSEQQLRQGGSILNQNRFLIRRARLTLRRAWRYVSLETELDGNTTSGLSFGLNRVEASVFYQANEDARPLAQLTVGMFRLPFGYELPESSGQRWFMERTQLSRALFPSEIDVGGRLSGDVGAFRYAAAVTNGEPLGEKSGFGLQDPNLNKDVTFSVGAHAKAMPILDIGGGVSFNTGKGFHPGTSATKGVVTWSDRNENGVVDSGELVGTPGQAATRSENFDRWALGADLQVRLQTPLGDTTLYGEIVAAKNLDRGFVVADPVSSSVDFREFGYYVGALQQITRYAIIGFRAEFYDPNADGNERRAAKSLPLNNQVNTYSSLVGITLPDRARLALQYDAIRDHLARNLEGVPADLKNDVWTLRLQVNL